MTGLKSEFSDGIRVDSILPESYREEPLGHQEWLRVVRPDEILYVLKRCCSTRVSWDPQTNTLEQMINYQAHFDRALVESVMTVLERRAGRSIFEMNRYGSPFSIGELLFDALISVARHFPPVAGDMNPLTGELDMAKQPPGGPTKTVRESTQAPGRKKDPSMERMAQVKASARSGKSKSKMGKGSVV